VANTGGLPDLVIAAAAAEHDATVLHYDRDFDLIAAVTGQPTRWIVPPGRPRPALTGIVT
jgi:predicted nuclease of predicted toxin-antitoxin system